MRFIKKNLIQFAFYSAFLWECIKIKYTHMLPPFHRSLLSGQILAAHSCRLLSSLGNSWAKTEIKRVTCNYISNFLPSWGVVTLGINSYFITAQEFSDIYCGINFPSFLLQIYETGNKKYFKALCGEKQEQMDFKIATKRCAPPKS